MIDYWMNHFLMFFFFLAQYVFMLVVLELMTFWWYYKREKKRERERIVTHWSLTSDPLSWDVVLVYFEDYISL